MVNGRPASCSQNGLRPPIKCKCAAPLNKCAARRKRLFLCKATNVIFLICGPLVAANRPGISIRSSRLLKNRPVPSILAQYRESRNIGNCQNIGVQNRPNLLKTGGYDYFPNLDSVCNSRNSCATGIRCAKPPIARQISTRLGRSSDRTSNTNSSGSRFVSSRRGRLPRRLIAVACRRNSGRGRLRECDRFRFRG